MSLLGDLWPGIRDAGWHPSALKKRLFGTHRHDLSTLCRMMMESDGDYSSLIIAEQILDTYARLDETEKLEFFNGLNQDYDLDPVEVIALARKYAEDPTSDTFRALTRAAEPSRQELFRRLNLMSGGTRHLVRMREDLLALVKRQPDLERLDLDFRHLLSSWFNRGFLVLRPVNWASPAHILDKIIAYEAVHEIRSWDELRRRLEPTDRHCYAFFHPVMEDEPLVFVEVALMMDMPSRIDEILDHERKPVVPEEATHAVFYSISNCHRGLAGISFGNFLIKQVAVHLQRHYPSLKSFVTISPAPGFRSWLHTQKAARLKQPKAAITESSKSLLPWAARYFLQGKLPTGEPLDPVARFHLKNGARLERLNANADDSPNGMKQSWGLMVNYVYDLGRVEENHEHYMKNHKVTCSTQVRKWLSST